METLLFSLLMGAVWFGNRRDQWRRMHLLASVLARFELEKRMETVADGYLRALGEADPQRAQQIWNMLEEAERTLYQQLQAFTEAMATLPAPATRFSTLPWGLPFARQLFPRYTADLRAVLQVHCAGIGRLMQSETGLSRKDRAYQFTAELLLLQHSCHWFCRSKPTAHARMLVRHKTPYSQLLASVSAQTRDALRPLLG